MNTHRPYANGADLDGMTRVIEAGLAASPDSGYMHPGDLQWRAFGPHGFPLSELIEVWEEGGAVVGWGFLESQSGYSWQVLPELRGTRVDAEVARWAHDATLRWRGEHNLDAQCGTEVFADDAGRIAILEAMGYRRREAEFVAFKRDLDNIPQPTLPGGWETRALRDVEIDSRATCQYEAFAPGSRTTPDTWRSLMANAPAYHRELDTVVVTREGVVAAAAMCWLDERNHIGLFEPVATRPAFQRQGIGKALMLQGLRALAAHGMTQAFVGTNATNAAARALYTSVGFQPRNHGYDMEWRTG